MMNNYVNGKDIVSKNLDNSPNLETHKIGSVTLYYNGVNYFDNTGKVLTSDELLQIKNDNK